VTTADAVIALRRHELRRVIASINRGCGWREVQPSAYLATAVYSWGAATGYVIGNTTAWWWALQVSPTVVGPRHQADGPAQACLAACREVHAIQRRGMRR
jgi:hypothetical protein